MDVRCQHVVSVMRAPIWKARSYLEARACAYSLSLSSLTVSCASAVSGLAFALKGAISVIFVSLPAFRNLLLLIGTGKGI